MTAETQEPPSSEQPDRVVVLGRIAGAFGVTGWIKVQSYTEPADNLLDYPVWLLRRSGWQPVKLLSGRMTAKGLQALLEGFEDRDLAAALRGVDIGVRRSELPRPAPGEYYWDDLLGMDVFSGSGERLGRLVEYTETAAHPLMVIQGERGHLVPLVKQRILAVDLEARRLTVDWELDW